MTKTIALDHENKRLLLKIIHALIRDVEDFPLFMLLSGQRENIFYHLFVPFL